MVKNPQTRALMIPWKILANISTCQSLPRNLCKKDSLVLFGAATANNSAWGYIGKMRFYKKNAHEWKTRTKTKNNTKRPNGANQATRQPQLPGRAHSI